MMRDNVDTNVQRENLEEMLLDLRGNSALAISAYAEDDDSVTRVLQVPEDSAHWLVALNADDQRSLTTEQIRQRLAHGELRADMLVWRRGLPTWQLLDSIAELRPVHALITMASCAPPPVEPSFAAGAGNATSTGATSTGATSANATVAGTTAQADPLVPPDLDLEGLSLESGSLRLKRAVMAVSALAMTATFVTLFLISSASKDKVREAARQREAAAAVKARAPEREPTAPEPAGDDSEDDPPAARDEPSERRQLRSELLPAESARR